MLPHESGTLTPNFENLRAPRGRRATWISKWVSCFRAQLWKAARWKCSRNLMRYTPGSRGSSDPCSTLLGPSLPLMMTRISAQRQTYRTSGATCPALAAVNVVRAGKTLEYIFMYPVASLPKYSYEGPPPPSFYSVGRMERGDSIVRLVLVSYRRTQANYANELVNTPSSLQATKAETLPEFICVDVLPTGRWALHIGWHFCVPSPRPWIYLEV